MSLRGAFFAPKQSPLMFTEIAPFGYFQLRFARNDSPPEFPQNQLKFTLIAQADSSRLLFLEVHFGANLIERCSYKILCSS